MAVPLAVLGFTLFDEDEEPVERTVGDDDADRIEGDEGRDFIDGQAGNDILNGQAGNDTIFGREGEDVLQGEDGDDMLCSGDGDDIVTGNRGLDMIEGQGGDDWVSGDYGADTVRGDAGEDTVMGGRGSDEVEGGAGDDLLFGGIIEGIPLDLSEMEALRDGESLSVINGGIEMRDDSIGNTLRGGTGDDDLVMGSGDMGVGGNGADTFHIMSEQNTDNAGAATVCDYTAGEDAITLIVDDTSVDADISVTDDGEDAVVRMGDTIVARVEGAAGNLAAGDITLIAENTVEGLFDPNSAAA